MKYFVMIFIMSLGIMPGFDKGGKISFFIGSLYAQNNHHKGGIYDVNDNFLGYAAGTKQGVWSKGDGYYFKQNELGLYRLWKNSPTKDQEMRCHLPTPDLESDNSKNGDVNSDSGEGIGGQENTSNTYFDNTAFTDWMNEIRQNIDNLPTIPPTDPLPTPPEEPIPPLITLPPDDDPNRPCATLTITGKLVKSPIGKNEGEITNLKAFNGTAPYAFSLDGKTALVGGSFTELASGNHTVNVTDAKGCTGSNTFKIDNCPTDANFTVTADMLKEINPSGYKIDPSGHSFSQEEIDNIFQQTAYYINKYMKNYEINTRQRLAYFLANASEETDNFRSFIERWNFSRDAIIKTWSRSLFPLEIIDKYVNCICVLDRAYADDGKGHNNGDEASKDGSKYRGRGLFHMTHKDSYYRFTNYYQKKYNDYTKDFVNNPDLIANATTSKTEVDFNLSVLAALWEFSVDKSKDKNGNSLPTNRNALLAADNDDLNLITSIINGGDNGLDIRKKKLEIAKRILCLK